MAANYQQQQFMDYPQADAALQQQMQAEADERLQILEQLSDTPFYLESTLLCKVPLSRAMLRLKDLNLHFHFLQPTISQEMELPDLVFPVDAIQGLRISAKNMGIRFKIYCHALCQWTQENEFVFDYDASDPAATTVLELKFGKEEQFALFQDHVFPLLRDITGASSRFTTATTAVGPPQHDLHLLAVESHALEGPDAAGGEEEVADEPLSEECEQLEEGEEEVGSSSSTNSGTLEQEDGDSLEQEDGSFQQQYQLEEEEEEEAATSTIVSQNPPLELEEEEDAVPAAMPSPVVILEEEKQKPEVKKGRGGVKNQGKRGGAKAGGAAAKKKDGGSKKGGRNKNQPPQDEEESGGEAAELGTPTSCILQDISPIHRDQHQRQAAKTGVTLPKAVAPVVPIRYVPQSPATMAEQQRQAELETQTLEDSDESQILEAQEQQPSQQPSPSQSAAVVAAPQPSSRFVQDDGEDMPPVVMRRLAKKGSTDESGISSSDNSNLDSLDVGVGALSGQMRLDDGKMPPVPQPPKPPTRGRNSRATAAKPAAATSAAAKKRRMDKVLADLDMDIQLGGAKGKKKGGTTTSSSLAGTVAKPWQPITLGKPLSQQTAPVEDEEDISLEDLLSGKTNVKQKAAEVNAARARSRSSTPAGRTLQASDFNFFDAFDPKGKTNGKKAGQRRLVSPIKEKKGAAAGNKSAAAGGGRGSRKSAAKQSKEEEEQHKQQQHSNNNKKTADDKSATPPKGTTVSSTSKTGTTASAVHGPTKTAWNSCGNTQVVEDAEEEPAEAKRGTSAGGKVKVVTFDQVPVEVVDMHHAAHSPRSIMVGGTSQQDQHKVMRDRSATPLLQSTTAPGLDLHKLKSTIATPALGSSSKKHGGAVSVGQAGGSNSKRSSTSHLRSLSPPAVATTKAPSSSAPRRYKPKTKAAVDSSDSTSSPPCGDDDVPLDFNLSGTSISDAIDGGNEHLLKRLVAEGQRAIEKQRAQRREREEYEHERQAAKEVHNCVGRVMDACHQESKRRRFELGQIVTTKLAALTDEIASTKSHLQRQHEELQHQFSRKMQRLDDQMALTSTFLQQQFQDVNLQEARDSDTAMSVISAKLHINDSSQSPQKP